MSAAGELGLVWAQARVVGPDGAPAALLGRAGTLPWHVPEDLEHFRDLTRGHAVVMGRATWDSLPPRVRPLPGRDNVVLTREHGWSEAGARVAHDVDDVLALLAGRTAWCIGGAQVYALLMPHATRLEITELEVPDLTTLEPGDTLAPTVPDTFVTSHEGPWHRSRSGARYRVVRLRATSGQDGDDARGDGTSQRPYVPER